MFGFLRRVWRSFWHYWDLASRLDDVEAAQERLEARVREHELAWTSEVDKLSKLNQRATQRLVSATAALAETQPTVTDVRASREARKAEILARRKGLNGGA